MKTIDVTHVPRENARFRFKADGTMQGIKHAHCRNHPGYKGVIPVGPGESMVWHAVIVGPDGTKYYAADGYAKAHYLLFGKYTGEIGKRLHKTSCNCQHLFFADGTVQKVDESVRDPNRACGFEGVTFQPDAPKSKQWHAIIIIGPDDKKYHTGAYKDEKAAAVAHSKARYKLFGKYVNPNPKKVDGTHVSASTTNVTEGPANGNPVPVLQEKTQTIEKLANEPVDLTGDIDATENQKPKAALTLMQMTFEEVAAYLESKSENFNGFAENLRQWKMTDGLALAEEVDEGKCLFCKFMKDIYNIEAGMGYKLLALRRIHYPIAAGRCFDENDFACTNQDKGAWELYCCCLRGKPCTESREMNT